MTILPTLGERSVQCVVTSPPYWGLRSYGFKKDDPARLKMIGLEPTFERHLWNLVRVFREVRRVLRDDGTLWLNYGDSFWGGKGQSGTNSPETTARRHQAGVTLQRPHQQVAGPGLTRPSDGKHRIYKPKDLLGMAWRVAFALQADGWYLRSDIIWHKRSPMPESVTDRPTKAHEYVFLFSKSPRYFYDAFAVREAQSAGTFERFGNGKAQRKTTDKAIEYIKGEVRSNASFKDSTPDAIIGGRNMRSVWTLSTEPCRDAHFATFPTELVARCLKAGTSEKGCCRTCGAPWKRVTESERRSTRPGTGSKVSIDRESGETVDCPAKPWAAAEVGNREPKRHVTDFKTAGWRPGCSCLQPTDSSLQPCTVLDPFAGSGTVGVVCRRLGLDFVGVELNPEYVAMAKRRIQRAMDDPTPETPQSVGQMELIE